jgi:phospholipase C
MSRKRIVALPLATLAVAAGSVLAATATAGQRHHGSGRGFDHSEHSWGGFDHGRAATPIKHVVVIFQENVSFDHYFGSYPSAANTDGQPFDARPHTPAVDGLLPATDNSLPDNLQHADDLTATNPNTSLPHRLDSSAIGMTGSPGGQLTCSQDHDYSDEQQSFDNGKMDQFVQSVGAKPTSKTPFNTPCDPNVVMDYYDGNTVTGMWNYAQHFSMSDNSFDTTFGPSTPGAINLVSGNTGNVDTAHEAMSPDVATPTSPNADLTPDGSLTGMSLTSDAQPYWDDCSTRDAVGMNGANIGDELNAAGLSWGWFEGGFRPSTDFATALADLHTTHPTSTFNPDEFKAFFAIAANRPAHSSNQALCSSVHPIGVALNGTGQWGYKDDYIPHHEPFQYYASTANPHHLTIPTDSSGQDTLAGLETLGRDTQSYANGKPQFDTPNHQYDTSDFDQLVAAIHNGDLPPSALPAVSFLKAPGYQDGHSGYSDPADEQAFVTKEINALERTPDWRSTAVIINYDDSDGFYDHVYSGVTNPSQSPADNLTNTKLTLPTSGLCGTESATFQPLAGQQGRCGFGPRLPYLVISPYAKRNYVDHTLSNQASTINFVEYNWDLPAIPGSFDRTLAGTDEAQGLPFDIAGMFDFDRGRHNRRLFLDPSTGQPAGWGGDARDHRHHRRHHHR